MLRTACKYFFIFLLFSVISVWISNNYGTVDIFWLGYRIHTSVPVLLILMWIMFFCVERIMAFVKWFLHPRNPFKKSK